MSIFLTNQVCWKYELVAHLYLHLTLQSWTPSDIDAHIFM